ncbi:MAG: DUF4397 domain-containing protein [Bacteroidota bacterium]
MKKLFNPSRKNLFAVGGLLVAAALFASCKKDNDVNTEIPAAGVMAFNLAPDKPGVIVSLGGNSLTNVPLNYTSFTGVYQRAFPGTRLVESIDASTGTPFASTSQNFEVNKYYSVFAMGTNGTYRNVVVEDELDSLPSTTGNAYLRFVNAVPDSGSSTVKITSGATTVDANSNYGQVSAFTGFAPGNVTLAVNNEGNVNASRTFPVEKDKVYTVLLVGVPGSNDSTKAVQIKYITNGTITP